VGPVDADGPDWSRLRHAFGAADDLPATLAALAATDPVVRADARAWLRATCCHQRTRYPASAAIVPTLVAHAADPGAPDRACALDLLADLAVGDADAALLGAPDPQAGSAEVRAIAAALTVPAALHHDPDPAVRARAARVQAALGRPAPPADDPDPAVRAARVLAGDRDPRHLRDPDAEVGAAAAWVHRDVARAAAIAGALPPPGGLPWFAGDAVRLAVATLAAAGPDPAARDALAHVAAHGAPDRAAAAALPALAAALDRLPPVGGFRPGGAPPAVARLARLFAVERPWLAAPEVWAALPRIGLPETPTALARWCGVAPAPSPLDGRLGRGRVRDLVPDLGRSGAGGPEIRRSTGTASATLRPGGRQRAPEGRSRAQRALGELGAAAPPALLALAEEEELPWEALAGAVRYAVAADPAGVWAAVLALAPDRTSPVTRWDARGAVSLPAGPVALLALGTAAAAALGREPPPALDPLAAVAIGDEAFHPAFLAWLDALPEARREAAALDLLRRRAADLRGQALVGALQAVDDDAVRAALPALDPAFAIEALPPARVAALAPALVARAAGFLAERARWMRERVVDERQRIDAAVRAKGAVAGRAWRAATGAPALPRARPRTGAPARAGEDLSRAAVELVLEEPLFGWLLGRIRRIDTDETPTMGLRPEADGGVALLVNPGWFAALPARQRPGALRHEVLHLLFGHPFRPDVAHADLGALGTAADLVVNRFAGRWPLPGDARRDPWGAPPLLPDAPLDDLYAALLARRFTDRAGPDEVWHSDHRHWRRSGDPSRGGDPLAASRAFDALVDEGVAALGGEALQGLAPGLRALVLGAVERHRSALDWRRVLRAFAASARRTSLHHTLTRRSRRYGTFPGIRLRRHQRLAVAVDTSGSIDGETLRRFFAEIDALHRAGGEVVVVECDAAVQRAWRYTGRPPEEVHGRGGTAFEPVMRWLHDPEVGRFDGLVYLTDGEGPAPATRPPCPVLWVLAPGGSAGEHLRFGRAVAIPCGA
jgi:predicted metal-dependent peptidase